MSELYNIGTGLSLHFEFVFLIFIYLFDLVAYTLSLNGSGGLRSGSHGLDNRLVLAILLHATQDHRLGSHGLPNLGVGESLELLVVPLSGSDGAALRVDEHGVVLGTQEVSDGVAVLSRVEWHNAVDAALELHVAGEAERVANVDKSAAGLGSDETHLTGAAGARRTDLETPLLTEEKSEGADVSMLLVTDAVLASKLRGEVVHH